MKKIFWILIIFFGIFNFISAETSYHIVKKEDFHKWCNNTNVKQCQERIKGTFGDIPEEKIFFEDKNKEWISFTTKNTEQEYTYDLKYYVIWGKKIEYDGYERAGSTKIQPQIIGGADQDGNIKFFAFNKTVKDPNNDGEKVWVNLKNKLMFAQFSSYPIISFWEQARGQSPELDDDGDQIPNNEDADADGDGKTDPGKVDKNGDGIDDNSNQNNNGDENGNGSGGGNGNGSGDESGNGNESGGGNGNGSGDESGNGNESGGGNNNENNNNNNNNSQSNQTTASQNGTSTANGGNGLMGPESNNKNKIFLENVPGMAKISQQYGDKLNDPGIIISNYLEWLIQLSVIIGSILAMVYIIIGGAQYMTTDMFQKKAEGKSRISNAILGLIFLIVGYVLFKEINPNILDFQFNYKASQKVEGNTISEISTSISDRREISDFLNDFYSTGVFDSSEKLNEKNQDGKKIIDDTSYKDDTELSKTNGCDPNAHYAEAGGQKQEADNWKKGGKWYSPYDGCKKVGGTRSWRNNNPGNIVCTEKTVKKYGACGCDHKGDKQEDNWRGLIFPNMAQGIEAQKKLLLSKYKNKTILGLAKIYQKGQNPKVYAESIAKRAGLNINQTIGSLTNTQFNKFVLAQLKVEGMRKGQIEGKCKSSGGDDNPQPDHYGR